jgi:hypothetical protein
LRLAAFPCNTPQHPFRSFCANNFQRATGATGDGRDDTKHIIMGFLSSLSSKLKANGSTRRNVHDESDNRLTRSSSVGGSIRGDDGSGSRRSVYEEAPSSSSSNGSGTRAWSKTKSTRGLSRPAVAGERTKLVDGPKPRGILKGRGGGGGAGGDNPDRDDREVDSLLGRCNTCKMPCSTSFVVILALALVAVLAVTTHPEMIASVSTAGKPRLLAFAFGPPLFVPVSLPHFFFMNASGRVSRFGP